MLTYREKIAILLRSRKKFKNWYLYPLIYLNVIKPDFVTFKTNFGLKMKIRAKTTDLMQLATIWLTSEYEALDCLCYFVNNFVIKGKSIVLNQN